MAKQKDRKTGRFLSEGLIKKCIFCGGEFCVKACNLEKRKYCSLTCYHKSMKGRKFSKKTRKRIIIANTGKKRSDRFKLEQSLRQLGSNNSNYKNGWTKDKIKRRNYGETKRFGKTKDEWIEYLGGKCAKCGMTNYESISKYGRRLSIHHKDGRGRNLKRPNNEINNITLLCALCHGKIHLTKERAKKMQSLSVAGLN